MALNSMHRRELSQRWSTPTLEQQPRMQKPSERMLRAGATEPRGLGSATIHPLRREYLFSTLSDNELVGSVLDLFVSAGNRATANKHRPTLDRTINHYTTMGRCGVSFATFSVSLAPLAHSKTIYRYCKTRLQRSPT